MIKPQRSNAIAELSPLTTFSFDGEGNIVEWDTGETKSGLSQPTDSDIDTKLASMISEYDAQAYARKRQAEFPSIKDLVVALYDENDREAIDAKRAEVKLKYPKPE